MALLKPKANWPIKIVAGVNDLLDFSIGATNYTAIVAPGTYDHVAWVVGEATTSLAAAVKAALAASYAAATWDVSVSPTGRVVIQTLNAVAFGMPFVAAAHAAQEIGPTLGFDITLGNRVAAISQTAEYQHQNGWYADDPVTDDTLDLPSYDRAIARAMGGQTKAIDFGVTYDRVVSLAYLQPYKVFKTLEDTHPNEAIERLIESGWARFRWWPDASTEAAFTDYVLAPDSAKSLPRNRLAPAVPLYSLTLKLWKYVP